MHEFNVIIILNKNIFHTFCSLKLYDEILKLFISGVKKNILPTQRVAFKMLITEKNEKRERQM